MFQILSLDGGGIRGAFVAAALAHFEEDLGVQVDRYFDLIAGTSTGGLIAIGLGLGLRPRELLSFYRERGPQVFPEGAWRRTRHWFRSKHDAHGLEQSLRDVFADRTFGSSQRRLVIPSYNLGRDDVHIFRTPHHDRLKRDWRLPAWKVGMATAAAPTYFSVFGGIDSMRLVDGGLWANNPTMVAVVEAHSVLGHPLESIHVFSIGATEPVSRRRRRLDRGGRLAWASEATEIIMRGQSLAAHNQAEHLLGNRYYRLNLQVPDGEFGLDTPSVPDLVAAASHVSRKEVGEFETRCCVREAGDYSPIYR